MKGDLDRAIAIADAAAIPDLRDYVYWYAAQWSNTGRDRIVQRLTRAPQDERIRWLVLLESAVRGMRGLPLPTGWSEIAVGLYDSSHGPTRQAAESLGAAFGDQKLYERMRRVLANQKAIVKEKQRALSLLANDAAPASLPLLLALLPSPQLTQQIIPLLRKFDDPAVATELLSRVPEWEPKASDAAVETLCSRVTWAEALLDALQNKQLDKGRLTAYHARQMFNLGNEQLNRRLAQEWGKLGQSSEQRQDEIANLVKAFQTAPLWAYDAGNGQALFKRSCANCHQPDDAADRIGPQLQGSGSKGIRYLVENVVDPNAVIGKDFLAQVVITKEGRVVSGLVVKPSDSAATVRTGTSTEVIARDQVEEIRVSQNSFMPEGLLSTFGDREKIELLKYLMSQ